MKRAVLVLLCLALPAAAQNLDLGHRIAASAKAAESLQGPLDGAWVLTDAGGRTLYFIQMVDPVTGRGLEAAWRDQGGHVGPVTHVRRSGDHLVLRFKGVRVTLTKSGGRWSGALVSGAQRRVVTLRR